MKLDLIIFFMKIYPWRSPTKIQQSKLLYKNSWYFEVAF
jgi:hypothetical protein